MCDDCCCDELREELREEREHRKELEDRLDDVEDNQEDNDEKDERIAELEETVDQQADRIDELREDNVLHSKERADLCKRVSEVEGTVSDDQEDRVRTEQTTTQEAETPLENVVDLPEQIADETLTANQERARFVAKDVMDYTRSVPAGRAIKSSEVRRVLTAKEDGSAHTQTASRVIERLAELGKDDVQIKETRGGERVVVFSNEIAERLSRQQANHTVVDRAKA